MSLDKYQSKRTFDTTPEPTGGDDQSDERGGLRFVVQKHDASQLHYDFRLEMGGALKSWAVPKGPSLRPEDKRLAMMVEDHPLDYRTFEGTIPKGNYGGGTVMVWDEGTYEPLGATGDREEDDKKARAGVHAGHLTFILHGQKLNGEFALVKMKDAEENAWLLIKAEKDQWARDEDVTQRNRSAATGRTLEEIAAGKPVVQDFDDAPRAQAPAELAPMLATLRETPFDDPEWLYEVKWDGYRIMAHVGGGRVRLITRGDQDYTERYQLVAKELSGLVVDAILDGEMVVVDEAGRSDFGALQDWQRTGSGTLVYYVFDLPYAYGHDLRGWPLTRRKEVLAQLVAPFTRVRLSDHVAGVGKRLFALAQAQNLEGIMAKSAVSTYQDGKRSRDWLKIKTHARQEAVVGGYTEPKGSRHDLGALVLGLYGEDGQLRYIGHTGGGFTEQSLAEAHARLKPLERKASPFATSFRTNAPVHWVKPELVAEVSFAGWTQDDHMRQPIFVGWREDKSARDVRRELPQAAAEYKSGAKTDQPDSRAHITHRDKVFWPDEGITKGDLLDYYDRVSEVLLPYLKDRPESLNRYPGGISGQHFFQKDVEGAPHWVKTVPIYSESSNKDIRWVVANDRDVLEYLVNLGCIELNPWHSCTQNLGRPDYCLLDIDAKTSGFDAVVKVAMAAHKLLDEYEIPAYPKTSGKTGLHVCIPLGANYTYEQSKQLAEIIMNLLHSRLPELTSVERSPDKRKGKIYLDYLQNGHGQTMAVAYCVRPVPGATVSTPLDWGEVNERLDPKAFTLRTMPERLDKVGDLWQGVLGAGVDVLAALGRMSV